MSSLASSSSGEAGRNAPDPRIVRAIGPARAGAALDLACGSGRHALWLAAQGWRVAAVDIVEADLPGVDFVRADLERDEFEIKPDAWDLIVCWLYWQPDLLDSISRGVRDRGYIALAGKTSGRFATSLESYRTAFPGWTEINSGEGDRIARFIARKC